MEKESWLYHIMLQCVTKLKPTVLAGRIQNEKGIRGHYIQYYPLILLFTWYHDWLPSGDVDYQTCIKPEYP